MKRALLVPRVVPSAQLRAAEFQITPFGSMPNAGQKIDRSAPHRYTTLPQVSGWVLNKRETRFAPVHWHRCGEIKTPAGY